MVLRLKTHVAIVARRNDDGHTHANNVLDSIGLRVARLRSGKLTGGTAIVRAPQRRRAKRESDYVHVVGEGVFHGENHNVGEGEIVHTRRAEDLVIAEIGFGCDARNCGGRSSHGVAGGDHCRRGPMTHMIASAEVIRPRQRRIDCTRAELI